MRGGPRCGIIASVVLAVTCTSCAALLQLDVTLADAGEEGSVGEAGAGGFPYILYYRFDGDTRDLSGLGHDGILHGNANVSASGVRGGALSCAAPGDFMEFSSDAFRPGDRSFTIAFYFKLALASGGGLANRENNTFFEKGGAWDNGLDHTPGTGIGYWSYAPEYLNAFVGDGPNHVRVAQATTPARLPDGNFHHVAFVVDREVGAASLYVDGTFAAAAPLPADPDGGPFGSASSASPGTLCAETDPRWTLEGAIDEFMILGGALGAADVARLASGQQ
jgi:hypothetical protein